MHVDDGNMSYRILRKLQGNELEIKEQIDEVSDGGDADYDTNSTSSQNRNNSKKQLNINRYDLVREWGGWLRKHRKKGFALMAASMGHVT